jgi:hypothetical protein
MYLDLLEPVKLGESVQWVRVRSAAPGNPLLLLIQQGPGLPVINEIGEFGRLLRLEAHFTVPYGTRRSPRLGRRSDGSRLGSEAGEQVGHCTAITAQQPPRHPVVLRPVSREDAMTADWTRLPCQLLARISTRITNEVPGVNPGRRRHEQALGHHQDRGVTNHPTATKE